MGARRDDPEMMWEKGGGKYGMSTGSRACPCRSPQQPSWCELAPSHEEEEGRAVTSRQRAPDDSPTSSSRRRKVRSLTEAYKHNTLLLCSVFTQTENTTTKRRNGYPPLHTQLDLRLRFDTFTMVSTYVCVWNGHW
jgi:hypothetical protein